MENQKVFCKNCVHLYSDRIDQCDFKCGIELISSKENFIMDKKELLEKQSSLDFLFAVGELDENKLNFYLQAMNNILVNCGYTIGTPSKLNKDNDCPFHRYFKEKENTDMEFSWKSLREIVFNSVFILALIVLFYLIIFGVIP